MTPTLPDKITLWCAAQSAPEAVEQAKARARAAGWRVLMVSRVTYRPAKSGPAWDVSLAVRVAS